MHNKCCGCHCSKMDGLVSATLTTDRRSYAPGESIDITGSTVVNDLKQPLLLRIRLHQYVIMSTAWGKTKTCTIKHVLFRGECPANSNVDVSSLVKGNGNGNTSMPAVFPSFYGGVENSSVQSNKYSCLKWTYVLDLKVGGEGKSGVSARLPILVACAAPYPQSVESAKHLTISSSNVYDTPFSVVDHAINGASPCDTTPYISSVEAGGVTVPAYTYESGVETNTIEDAGAVGENPHFQPLVNTFESLSYEDTTPPSTEGTVGEAKSIDLLLKDMEDSFDRRQTVSKWMRDHPLEASLLTPKQVKDILSAVPFSLDQPSVAAEIAVGIGNKHNLTCEHVLGAVEVCTYQQVDVAKAMAPFVNDPQNKQSVLNQIEFSFEREAVSKCFPSLA